jgi:RND family efflux transporter MFP subunit
MRLLLKLLKRTLPLWILAGGVGVYYFLMATRPVAERREPPEPVLRVEAVHLQPQAYTLTIESQGTVRARTESTLIPEVSGRVLAVAENFREGGFFNAGDVLLEIDPSDYLTAVTVAEANLAEARVRLAEEQAQALQAERDWERLGRSDTPPELALRVPQLALARANVAAAEARLQQARRDLERTRITAPYRGRVLTKRVDVGQVVSPGNLLAELYAVDYAEIRLPLTSQEFAMLDIARDTRGREAEEADFPVTLTATFGSQTAQWEGRVVRVEGAVDARSRQVFVVAQVDDPYGPDHPQPLKVGLFVEARIEGRTLEDVYVLPRTALREARFVLTIDEENRLLRVPVEALWATAAEVVFREPAIEPGTLASVTQVALAIDGMHVQPIVQGRDKPARPGPAPVAKSLPGE